MVKKKHEPERINHQAKLTFTFPEPVTADFAKAYIEYMFRVFDNNGIDFTLEVAGTYKQFVEIARVQSEIV